MKLCIDTDVLSKRSMSLKEFLILLINYLDIDYKSALNYTLSFGYGQRDLNNENKIVLPDSTKDLIVKILTESSPKLEYSPIADYYGLAQEMQSIFPRGNKEGTNSSWRDSTDNITQKLMVLVTAYGFIFTELEALNATRWYVHHWQDDRKYMKTLKNFILRTHNGQIDSDFMTIIENQRDLK